MLVANILLALAVPAAPPPIGENTVDTSTGLNHYFDSSDYPPEARRRGEQGTVTFRILIGRDGMVARCVVTASSGSASLDEATCRVARNRLRFRPARNNLDQPVAVWSQQFRVVWRL